MSFKLNPILLAILAAGLSQPVMADDAAIKRQLEQMQKQIDELTKRLAERDGKQEKSTQASSGGQASASPSPNKAIQLYGQLRLSADNYSSDFGSGNKGSTVKSNASRIGVKGEVPTTIGDTSMIYQAELLYGAADNTAQEIQWREGYAGLKGGWGSARLGRIDVPYKTTLTIIDPWNDNAPQSRGYGGRQGSSALHSSYFTNTLEYLTPKIGGFTGGIWLSTQLDGETSSIHDASPLTNFQGGDAKGLGVKFNSGPWYAGADWISIDADRSGSGTPFVANTRMRNDSGWQIAGRYKAGNWSASAMFEDVEDLGMGTNVYLNGTYKLGNTSLIATMGRNRDAAVYSNRDIDTWSLGAKYALTKDSELFAAWVNREENAFGTTAALDYQTLTVGINAKFGY